MRRGAIFVLCILLCLMPIGRAEAVEDIFSEAAIVIEFETGDILYAREIDRPLFAASLTKIMTAYILFEEIAAGNLTLETQIPVSEHVVHISRAIDHRGPFSDGASYTADTLLKLLFLPSSNAASIAVAEHISGTEEVFTRRMEETAVRLGMTAQYQTAHGLWGENIKTAHCIAELTRHFIRTHPEILAYSSMESFRFYETEYSNINALIFEREEIDGFKTGATAAAGYCLVTTGVRDGQRVIVVTMNAPDRSDAFADSQRLLEHGFAVLEHRTVSAYDPPAENIPPPPPVIAEEEDAEEEEEQAGAGFDMPVWMIAGILAVLVTGAAVIVFVLKSKRGKRE